jgi:hypothetical protein
VGVGVGVSRRHLVHVGHARRGVERVRRHGGRVDQWRRSLLSFSWVYHHRTPANSRRPGEGSGGRNTWSSAGRRSTGTRGPIGSAKRNTRPSGAFACPLCHLISGEPHFTGQFRRPSSTEDTQRAAKAQPLRRSEPRNLPFQALRSRSRFASLSFARFPSSRSRPSPLPGQESNGTSRKARAGLT